MKAKLLIIISCLFLLSGCCTGNPWTFDGGCDTCGNRPCASGSGWGGDPCNGPRCTQVFTNIGYMGGCSACYVDTMP